MAADPPAAPAHISDAVGEWLRIALPAVVTMTSYTVMQFVDALIVRDLGPDAIAAVGNGGIAAFVPASVMFGVLSIVSTFVSQNLGAGRPERGAAYAWNGLWLAIATWLLVLLPVAALLPQIFAGMRELLHYGVSSDAVSADVSQRVAEWEVAYGRILLVGMVITICARGISHYFYGIHRPAIVMVAALVANLVNIGLSFVLVRGLFGAPAMGVEGAAVATVIGGAVELAIPMALFLSPRNARELGTRATWKPSPRHMGDLLRVGWPAGLMMGNEIVCWWIFMAGFVASFDRPGEVAVNNMAAWIVLRYMHLSFMPAVGMSIAIGAIVGRYVGARQFDVAARRTWLGVALTAGYMSAWALVFVVFREPLVAIFIDRGPESGVTDPEVARRIVALGSTLLIVAAAFQLFDAVAIALSGALRGAGDTVWPGVATVVLSWGVIVGGGWLAIRVFPEHGVVGPWIAAAAYIVLLAAAMLLRFLSGRWTRLRVVHDDDAPPAAGAALPGGAAAEQPPTGERSLAG